MMQQQYMQQWFVDQPYYSFQKTDQVNYFDAAANQVAIAQPMKQEQKQVEDDLILHFLLFDSPNAQVEGYDFNVPEFTSIEPSTFFKSELEETTTTTTTAAMKANSKKRGLDSDIDKKNLKPRLKRRKSKNGASSKYRGVSFYKRDKRFVARVYLQGKHRNLGSFINEEEAARAVDAYLLEVYGPSLDRTLLNFP